MHRENSATPPVLHIILSIISLGEISPAAYNVKGTLQVIHSHQTRHSCPIYFIVSNIVSLPEDFP